MTAFGITMTILAIIGLVAIKVLRNMFDGKLEKMRANAQSKIRRGEIEEREVDRVIAAERFWAPSWVNTALIGIIALGLVLSTFHGLFFYAEPTFKYHIRPIWGGEVVVSGETGYRLKGFGRVNDWKIAMSVLSARGIVGDNTSDAESDTSISATLQPQQIIFLDQVDADAESTVRFRLPDNPEEFLELVHDFRTPENLLNTELIPAFKETLKATGSLMSAEEYFSGGRTEFFSEFEDQMVNGIYKVKRIQVMSKDIDQRKRTADASQQMQDAYEDDGKVIFKVEKQLDRDGEPLRKEQKFKDYGVTVVSARVTEMIPNDDFQKRMKAKQDASAQRAVNREQRIQEEEQKFLAVAKGEREIAEEQAMARKTQMKRTTDEETEKRLALIRATKLKEQAEIEKETAAIYLEKANIEAQTKERLADAEAYEKKALLQADNALKVKVNAEIKIHELWADAFAKRAVPQYVWSDGGAGGEGSTPVGSDLELKRMMQLLTVKAAQSLDYDRKVESQ